MGKNSLKWFLHIEFREAVCFKISHCGFLSNLASQPKKL